MSSISVNDALPAGAAVPHNAPSLHAGCVGDPKDADAGCVETSAGQVNEPAPSAAVASAGCAAAAPAAPIPAPDKPPGTVREFERALRGLGFTRQQAENVARRGFSGAAEVPEPAAVESDETKQLCAALESLARSLKATP